MICSHCGVPAGPYTACAPCVGARRGEDTLPTVAALVVVTIIMFVLGAIIGGLLWLL